MSFIQEFFTSRNNKANPATYVGQKDRLWYDSTSNTIRISDGATPGGLVVSGGGGGPGTYGNINVAAFLPTYTGSISNASDIISLNLNKANVNSPIFTGNAVFNSTSAVVMPAGSTAERPLGVPGQIRFNTTLLTFEGFTNTWGAIAGGGTSGTGWPYVDLGFITETVALQVDFGTF